MGSIPAELAACRPGRLTGIGRVPDIADGKKGARGVGVGVRLRGYGGRIRARTAYQQATRAGECGIYLLTRVGARAAKRESTKPP